MKFIESFFQSRDYRPDVDGLRAFAVLAVMLFHAWPGQFAFGIFGVDVFFVISGYLITNIILKDIARGDFSLKKFYQRRILRILPPLVFILFACLAAGFFLLTAGEYARLGANARAGAFFGGNFFLMAEAGYFDVASSLKPLLHLWSLGIEEQFYIVYPFLLLLAARYSTTLFVIALLGGLSLLAGPQISARLFGDDGVARYYSPLVRAFDLCAGALVAICAQNRRGYPKNGALFAFPGLMLLVVSCLVIDSSKPWPSWLTLLPVGGIALLIWAGPLNSINRLLFANRPAVFVGLISYELYLWHWPLLSFANILAGGQEHVAGLAKAALLFAAIALAFLLFYYYGLPIRRKYRESKIMSLALLAVLAAAGLCGHFVLKADGLPARLERPAALKGWEAPIVRADMARAAQYFPKWREYTDEANQPALEDSPGELDIALLGDSHAQQLYAGLREALEGEKKIGVFPVSGQAPFMDVATMTENFGNYRKNGWRLMNEAYRTVLDNPNIKTVILAHNPDCSMNDALDPHNPADRDGRAIMERAMRESLAALQKAGRNVILVLDNPALDFDPASLEPRPISLLDRAGKMEREKAEASPARLWYNALCEKMAAEFANVRLADLFEAFCDEKSCVAYKDGQPLYWDRGHLTLEGSRLAARYLLGKLGMEQM